MSGLWMWIEVGPDGRVYVCGQHNDDLVVRRMCEFFNDTLSKNSRPRRE